MQPPGDPTRTLQPLSDVRQDVETGLDEDRTRTHGPAATAGTTKELPSVPGFEIRAVLGHGGMGVVYKAWQPSLKRFVALKMILAGEHASPQHITRFRTEAQAAAQLHHPHIVQIYEIGEQRGQPYVALEFIDGGSLAQKTQRKPQVPEQAARIVEMLARASHYFHQRNIVHRDLKPANVLLAPCDNVLGVLLGGERFEPKITDFGLAKQLAEDAGQTVSGAVLGTPSYMAPEQAAGKTQEIGPLVDVYALGVILYELLTGRTPFHGDSHTETMRQVLHEEAVPPSRILTGIPRDLETICLKAMSREPKHRYTSALALAQDLERFLAGEPILARRRGMVSRGLHRMRRNARGILGAAIIVVALAVAGYLVVSARTAGRVVDLTNQFDIKLRSVQEPSEHFLSEMDEIIAEIDLFDPQRADQARAALYDHWFAGRIEPKLKSHAQLSRDKVPAIKAEIDLLRERRPQLHALLHEKLQQRLTKKQLIVELKAPFENREKVFQNVLPRVVGSALITDGDGRRLTILRDEDSRGPVEMEATFAADWQKGDKVGLVLDASRASQRGYQFVLSTGKAAALTESEASPKSRNLGEARQHDALQLAILRNNVLLRHQPVPKVADGPITLRASREGSRLELELLQKDARVGSVRFQDTFPPGGRREESGPLKDEPAFALYWPSGVSLTEVRVRKQALPPSPGKLEKGDDFYARGELEQAVAAYRGVTQSASGELGQEARCKEALCLIDLKRVEEAKTLLQPLVTEAGDRWPLVSACRLWLLYLQENRRVEADALAATLLSRGYTPEQLASVISVEVRDSIRAAYSYDFSEMHFFLRPSEAKVRGMERMIAIHEALQPDPQDRFYLHWVLLRPYRILGETDKALALMDTLLMENAFVRAGYARDALFEEYGWVCRERSEPNRALGYLHNEVTKDKNLLVERARLFCAIEHWGQAQSDLDEFFRHSPVEKGNLAQFTGACLLQGFLKERQGDTAGALSAWKRGVCEPGGGGIPLLQSLVLASLAGDIPDERAARFQNRMFKALPGDIELVMRASGFRLSAGILRDMWRHTRGHEAARKIALQNVSYVDYLKQTLLVTGYTILRNDAMPATISPAQEEEVWKLTERVVDGVLRGQLIERNAVQLALSWKGTTNFLGWGGLSRGIDPALRGPLAYVLGFRYERLGQTKDALDLFRTARGDAPANSSLRSLAEKEVQRLERK